MATITIRASGARIETTIELSGFSLLESKDRVDVLCAGHGAEFQHPAPFVYLCGDGRWRCPHHELAYRAEHPTPPGAKVDAAA